MFFFYVSGYEWLNAGAAGRQKKKRSILLVSEFARVKIGGVFFKIWGVFFKKLVKTAVPEDGNPLGASVLTKLVE